MRRYVRVIFIISTLGMDPNGGTGQRLWSGSRSKTARSWTALTLTELPWIRGDSGSKTRVRKDDAVIQLRDRTRPKPNFSCNAERSASKRVVS